MMKIIDIYLPSHDTDRRRYKFNPPDSEECFIGEERISWADVYPSEEAEKKAFVLVREHDMCLFPKNVSCKDLILNWAECLLEKLIVLDKNDTVHFFLHLGGDEKGDYLKKTRYLNKKAPEIEYNLGIQCPYFYCWGALDPFYEQYVLNENSFLLRPDAKGYHEYIESVKEYEFRSDVIISIDDIHEIWNPISVMLNYDKMPDDWETIISDKMPDLLQLLENLLDILQTAADFGFQVKEKHRENIEIIINTKKISTPEDYLDWTRSIFYMCEMIRSDREKSPKR